MTVSIPPSILAFKYAIPAAPRPPAAPDPGWEIIFLLKWTYSFDE